MRKLSKLAFGALFAGTLATPGCGRGRRHRYRDRARQPHRALSGPVSAWGIGSTEGMRMRFDEANEKGINGRKIKFIVEDHQYQVPRAVQAANKLINNDKIFAMVGALGTPHEQRRARRAAGQGRAEPDAVHGGALHGRALPQAQVRGLLHLLRPGALGDQALRREGGQEEGVRDVPGYGLRSRDPGRRARPGQGPEARGGGGGLLRPGGYRVRRARSPSSSRRAATS